MTTPNNKSDSADKKYLSKRVLLNGQFVTLYSSNGQTWVSSPEDIPDLMARLDNARIVLSTEKPAEGGDKGAAKPKEGEAKQESSDNNPKVATGKYRMKGPKPRPILRQGGVVIKGTPVEPISASTTVADLSPTERDPRAALGKKGANGSSNKVKQGKHAQSKQVHVTKNPAIDKRATAKSNDAKRAVKSPVAVPAKGSVKTGVALSKNSASKNDTAKSAAVKSGAAKSGALKNGAVKSGAAKKVAAKNSVATNKQPVIKVAATKNAVAKKPVASKKKVSTAKKSKSSRR